MKRTFKLFGLAIFIMAITLGVTACNKGGEEAEGMIYVPGGSFEMGSSNASINEEPVHTVTLTGFYMGKYPVTQEQYQAVMKKNPSHFHGSWLGILVQKRPVEKVSWFDAVEFCNKLSEAEGLQQVYTITGRTPASGYPITDATVTTDWNKNGYRLPTEAQWEYAAKGGNGSPGNYTYAGSDTIKDVAWYKGKKTHVVGKKKANSLGLYDMSGNVWEWCWDWYDDYGDEAQTDPTGAISGTSRVRRGGGYGVSAEDVRSTSRGSSSPSLQGLNLGFRLTRP